MKRTIGILDLIIFLLSIIVLLIAFFMNMDKLSLLIGVGLIILLGIAHTRLEKITGLSSENPKIKTMRRMNRLSMVFVVILYLIPLVKKDLIGNVPYQFFLLITIMIFSGNIAPKLPFNKYMGLMKENWTMFESVIPSPKRTQFFEQVKSSGTVSALNIYFKPSLKKWIGYYWMRIKGKEK